MCSQTPHVPSPLSGAQASHCLPASHLPRAANNEAGESRLYYLTADETFTITHTHTHTQIHMHVCTHKHTNARVRAHTHTHAHTCISGTSRCLATARSLSLASVSCKGSPQTVQKGKYHSDHYQYSNVHHCPLHSYSKH